MRGQGDEVAMVACLCALGKLPTPSQWGPRQADSRNAPPGPTALLCKLWWGWDCPWGNTSRENIVRVMPGEQTSPVGAREYIWLPLAGLLLYGVRNRKRVFQSLSLSHRTSPSCLPSAPVLVHLLFLLFFIYILIFQYLPFVWITHEFLMKYFQTLGIAESEKKTGSWYLLQGRV